MRRTQRRYIDGILSEAARANPQPPAAAIAAFVAWADTLRKTVGWPVAVAFPAAFDAAVAEHIATLHGHPVRTWMDEPERFFDSTWVPADPGMDEIRHRALMF